MYLDTVMLSSGQSFYNHLNCVKYITGLVFSNISGNMQQPRDNIIFIFLYIY